MKRELGVDTFTYKGVIGHYLLDWQSRSESPQQNGCTHLLIATKVVLPHSSVLKNLHVDAHSEVRWFSPAELDEIDCNDNLKSVLQDATLQ